MALDITDKSTVQRIITDIESSENRDRKTYEWRSYEIYSGDQRKWILEQLQKLFPDSYESMRISNVNILKKVVDKLARVYKEKPIRKIENETSNDNLEKLYEHYDQKFKNLDKFFNRHRCLLAWVVNRPEMKTEFDLKMLPPYLFDLVIDPDTNKVLCVILSYPDTDVTHSTNNPDESKIKRPDGENQLIAESPQDSGEYKTYSLYTPENHVVIQSKKRMVKNEKVTTIDFVVDEKNPGMINPLGALPFVWITSEPDLPEFPISSPLPFESVNINVLNSDLLTASALQGFGQLVIKYPEGSKVSPKHTGFTTAIELPQKIDPDIPETTAEYINPNPDLNGMRQVIMEYAEAVISDEGLQNFSLVGSTKNFTSGLDRALSMADVTERRKENQDIYAKAERQIFNIIKKYDKLNGTRLFKEEDELTIHYKEPSVVESEKEKLELIEKKLDLGLIEPYQALMMIDRTLTEDKAKDRIEEMRNNRMDMISRLGNGDFEEREREEN